MDVRTSVLPDHQNALESFWNEVRILDLHLSPHLYLSRSRTYNFTTIYTNLKETTTENSFPYSFNIHLTYYRTDILGCKHGMDYSKHMGHGG